MKTYNEILKLIDAGFTRDEILAMEEQTQPEQPEPVEEQSQAQEQTAQPQLADQLMELIGRMDKKLNEIQAANIYASQQPEKTQSHVMTDVEALEEIIRPYRPDK